MKKLLVLVLFVTVSLSALSAQHLGLNMGFRFSKEWKLSKKFRLEAQQQFQLSPDIRNLKTKPDDVIFAELGLFPYPQENDTEEEDEEEENQQEDGNSPFGELNDARQRIKLEYRSATSLNGSYRFGDAWRASQGYSLLLDQEGEMRHLFRSSLSMEPDVRTKKWDFPQRLSFQLAGRERKDRFIWEHDIAMQSGIEWSYKKKHCLYLTSSVNGSINEATWKWDRFRTDFGIEYAFTKRQEFDLSFRFQQRLNAEARQSYGLNIRYAVEF